MDNIILIGMPGTGKSTIGVLLAKYMGYKFIDSDLIIQEKAGKRLFEIMRDFGNEYFLQLENRVNSELCVSHTVIATGGSAVFGEDAMNHFKEIGTIVYIRTSLSELEKRITNFETRGILKAEGQTLADIFAERTPLYERWADITVDTTTESVFENYQKIEEALKERRV